MVFQDLFILFNSIFYLSDVLLGRSSKFAKFYSLKKNVFKEIEKGAFILLILCKNIPSSFLLVKMNFLHNLRHVSSFKNAFKYLYIVRIHNCSRSKCYVQSNL